MIERQKIEMQAGPVSAIAVAFRVAPESESESESVSDSELEPVPPAVLVVVAFGAGRSSFSAKATTKSARVLSFTVSSEIAALVELPSAAAALLLDAAS